MGEQIKLFAHHIYKRIDWLLLIPILISCAFGLLLISSATASFGTSKLIIVQTGGIILGLIAALVLLTIEHENLARFSIPIYGLCILLLVATLIFGKEVMGNKNWIALGPINIQPSEFVKIGFILTFAKHLSSVREYINNMRALIPLGLHFAIIAGLVAMEGDLGTTLVFLFIFLVMLMAAGLHWGFFLGGGALVAAAAPFIFEHLDGYQQMRILAVYDPSLDPLGYGYHTIQSKIALGSGGLFGSGLYNGIQTQYGILPEKQTDFIFSVCGEELGFVGCLLIIALELAILFRLLYVARYAADHMGCFICIGLAAMLFIQAAENIGMCLGLLPVIGLTLPFFSYGGSSVLALCMSSGLAMSVNAARPKEFFFKDKK
ncbi:MAG: rod shape-determining protein RodA [Clostridia bacterium]|nr:rod shape-determining protein RodA [Clostridia bacterium]